jgi:hypothetical protein
MLELSLTVDWGEGPQTAQTNGWTVIQFERKTKQKYTQIAQQGLGMEDLYLLAWIALKDAGTVVPDFDRFCKQVKSVDVDAPDTNPTHGGATEEQ